MLTSESLRVKEYLVIESAIATRVPGLPNLLKMTSGLLAQCHFTDSGTKVDLAVSGGPDSLGLLLLALEAGLDVTVHHVDHHARPSSGEDAATCETSVGNWTSTSFFTTSISKRARNFEARARSARRKALPDGVLTGHTMDDLAETVLLNMLRGAGLDGLSPMVNDPTKPLRDLRRVTLHEYVATLCVRRAPRRDER